MRGDVHVNKEQIFMIRQRANERVLPPMDGLTEEERERVRWAFKDRRNLLTEVTALREERSALRAMLAEVVDACQHRGVPDGGLLARARRLLAIFGAEDR
jgi:hypothetical protein